MTPTPQRWATLLGGRWYASPDRDLLLQRELRWLTSGDGEATSSSRPGT
jgi:hypothetical protein